MVLDDPYTDSCNLFVCLMPHDDARVLTAFDSHHPLVLGNFSLSYPLLNAEMIRCLSFSDTDDPGIFKNAKMFCT